MSVINLSRYRKRREREDARKKADANAQRHGQTKIERQRDAAQRERLDAALDGAKRNESESEGESEGEGEGEGEGED